jgi:hypothetical protein
VLILHGGSILCGRPLLFGENPVQYLVLDASSLEGSSYQIISTTSMN